MENAVPAAATTGQSASLSAQQTETAEALASRLTSDKQLKKSMLINLFTKMLPIAVGILITPVLMSVLGNERFGVIQIYWTIVGFSTVFDFGLGRALTQLVAKSIAKQEHEQLGSTVWTIITLMVVLSVAFMLTLLAGTETIVHYINVSPEYFQEACRAFRWLVMSLPLLIVFIALTGILEAFQRFWDTNLQRYPILFFNFIAPVLLLKWYPHLDWMMMMVVVGRIIALAIAFNSVSKCFPHFWQKMTWDSTYLKGLFQFGSWTTVSNLVRPFMLYQDRLFLANWLSPAITVFYTTPYDMLTKQSLLAESVLNVLFPAFGTTFVQNPQKARGMYLKALLMMAGGFGALAVLVALLAKPLLSVWLSPEFAEKSYVLTMILAFVHGLACVGLVPLSMVQASGRSDITAKVLLCQFPFYLAALWYGVHQFGLIAAPSILLLRLMVDITLMHFQAMRLLNRAVATQVENTI